MKVLRYSGGYSRACLVAWLVLTCLGCPAIAVQTDFSAYEIILSRQPFGPLMDEPEPVVAAAPAPAPEPAPPSFVQQIELVAITTLGSKVRVGFTDKGAKPVDSYLIWEGETQGDYTVVEASYEKQEALLKKGDEEVWISMTDAPSPAGDASLPSGVRGGRPARVRTADIPFRGPSREEYKQLVRDGKMAPPVSPRSVLNRGQDFVSADEFAKLPKATREAALRRYNMDVIRSKGKFGIPLPIRLTKEEDAQLVKEGVLVP